MVVMGNGKRLSVFGGFTYHLTSATATSFLSSSCSTTAPGRLVFLATSCGGVSARVLMEVAGRERTERPVQGREHPKSCSPTLSSSLPFSCGSGEGSIISPSSGAVGISSIWVCDGVEGREPLEEEGLETKCEE